jgi:hypothetical protein
MAGGISFQVPKEVQKSLKKIKADGRKVVQVVGKIQNGKLQIAQKSLAEIARKYPNANISFVAVNAPFKTA